MEEQKKKVLVTDDDATLGKTLKGCLEELGFEVVFVQYAFNKANVPAKKT